MWMQSNTSLGMTDGSQTARALEHVGVQPQRPVELSYWRSRSTVHAGHNGRAALEVRLQAQHLKIENELVHKLSERELVGEGAAAVRAAQLWRMTGTANTVFQHTPASMKFVPSRSAWCSWARRFAASSPNKHRRSNCQVHEVEQRFGDIWKVRTLEPLQTGVTVLFN
jgi:hypothetical protein